jgi:antitoxin FitA
LHEINEIIDLNIDDDLKERLRVRAALHGHSMEEEARVILRRAMTGITGKELLELSQNLFGQEHGVEIELPSRAPEREAPKFTDRS